MKQIDRTDPIVETVAVGSSALFKCQSAPCRLEHFQQPAVPDATRERRFDGASADASMTSKSAQMVRDRANLGPHKSASMPKKQAMAPGVATAVGAATPWAE